MARPLESYIPRTPRLMGCPCANVISMYRILGMDGETTNLQSAILEESEYCYALFIVTIELKQPKSLTSASVVTQTLFLEDRHCVHCSIWAYTAGSLRKFHL